MKIADRLIQLVGFEECVKKLYEQKKVYLIEVNRVGKDKELEKQLVFEINVLASLLKEQIVDISNISDTLNAHEIK
jgi:hypothetical protein